MVFARTKLLIQDDLMRPRPVFRINYTGPRPTKLYKEIPEILASVFRVHVGQIQEKQISWTKGDPEKFRVLWEMDKDIDRFTYVMIELELDGSESKGVGSAKLSLKDGILRTEYPQDTVWERSLLYELLRVFWSKVFYWHKREQYIRDGRRQIAEFIEEVKKVMHEQKEA